MTITRKQVADLRPGDVVEVTSTDWPNGTVVRGPLWRSADTLQVGGVIVRHWDGRQPYTTSLSLTVISRAPQPLYVNHDRTNPVPGDVVRDADDDEDRRTWMYRAGSNCSWLFVGRGSGLVYGGAKRELLPDRLRLLVDGETGQVVP